MKAGPARQAMLPAADRLGPAARTSGQRLPATAWRDACLALLLLLVWTAGLGQLPLFDVDEGAFAEASRDMLARGDWGHTMLNGQDRFDKPVGVYWLQAASIAWFGATEWAVRLPSALCGWAWALALAGYAAARWGPRTGWLAALMLSTTIGPALIGRAATADALLNLLLTLALLDLARSLVAVDDGAAARARARVGAWVGLGLLVKGPVALLLPAGALLLHALLQHAAGGAHGGRMAAAALGNWARDPRPWGWMLLIALPWYAHALQRHGMAFVDGFVMRHHVERLATPLEGHRGPWLYHLLALPLLLLPWTPMLVRVWRERRRLLAAPDTALMLAWSLFALGFFTLAATKLPHYALYAATPLVLLAAQALGRSTPGRWLGLALVGSGALLVLAGAASAALGLLWAEAGAPAHERALLEAAVRHPGPATGSAPLVLAAQAALALWCWHRPRRRRAAALIAAVLAIGWWLAVVVPWWAQVLQAPVKALALQARERGLPLVQWGLHQPSVGFYRGQPAERRMPRIGEAALVRQDRLGRLLAETEADDGRWEVITPDGAYRLVVRHGPTR